MAKFQKPGSYQKPLETPVAAPAETAVIAPEEAPMITPEEAPTEKPAQVCGINGCTTWYDDPAIMKRHLERQHGIGGPPNLNQPKPRNAVVKLA